MLIFPIGHILAHLYHKEGETVNEEATARDEWYRSEEHHHILRVNYIRSRKN